jgi:Na+/H+ antiporter
MSAQFLIALAVAAAVIGSVGLERASGLPGTVFLVPAGVGLSYLPGLPRIGLDPKVVFFVFLPPLLYAAAFFTSPRDWRTNWRSITALAIGLVVATSFAVAGVAGRLIGRLDWAAAFVLGAAAAVAPTDPVAATAVIGRLGGPARLRTVLEGESLVNDGVGLVIFSIAVSAGVSGSFSILHGFVRFVEVAAGGIAVGAVVGWAVVEVRRRIHDPMVEITVSLLTPYLAYLPANQAHVSGVLATVATGAFLGWRSEGLFTAQTRMQAFAFWDVLRFLLESTLFVLLGAQFRSVVGGLSRYAALSLVWYALLTFAVVAVVRLLWQFIVPHFLRPGGVAPWRERLVLGWAGLRGAVTLAAALSIPHTLPDRSLVLFLAFSVILATTLVEGLTLPLLVTRLRIAQPAQTRRREIEARVKLAEAALNRLVELAAEDETDVESIEPLRTIHGQRIERLRSELDDRNDDSDDGRSSEELQLEVIDAQREMLRRLSGEGALDRTTAQRLQRELDLEESRTAD